jgi:hypothetical protein
LLCCGFNRTTQQLTEFFLQRLDLLLDVGCLTQLSRCYVYHGAESMDGFGGSVKRDLNSTVAGKTGSFELERTVFAVNAPFAKPQALD